MHLLSCIVKGLSVILLLAGCCFTAFLWIEELSDQVRTYRRRKFHEQQIRLGIIKPPRIGRSLPRRERLRINLKVYRLKRRGEIAAERAELQAASDWQRQAVLNSSAWDEIEV